MVVVDDGNVVVVDVVVGNVVGGSGEDVLVVVGRVVVGFVGDGCVVGVLG